MTLPGGFSLPVALTIETYEDYAAVDAAVTEEQCRERITSWTESYLLRQMNTGAIDSSVIHWSSESDRICMTGKYICTEMIGKVQREQIGEYHGENS